MSMPYNELLDLLNDIRDDLQRIAEALERQNRTSWPRTPEGLPICPKHNEPMRKREKQGDTWFSHRVTDPATGENQYCRGYASKNGPGWYIEDDSSGALARQPKPDPPAPAAKAATEHSHVVGYLFASGDPVPDRAKAAFGRFMKEFGDRPPTAHRFWTWFHENGERLEDDTVQSGAQPDDKPAAVTASQNGQEPPKKPIDIDEINDLLFG